MGKPKDNKFFNHVNHPIHDFFKPAYTEAKKKQDAVEKVKDGKHMAWNYEKGCEEVVAYEYGKNGIYTPPNWKNNHISGLAVRWEEAEAKAKYYDRPSALPTVRKYWDEQAVSRWYELEKAMLWDKAAEVPDFRRKYVEWLSRATEMEVEMGISDVDINNLPMMQRMIALGFRQLAKETHPDLGGDPEQFMKVKDVKKQLDAVLEEVKDLL